MSTEITVELEKVKTSKTTKTNRQIKTDKMESV